jgi:two-component system sensor histidine kinase MprB
MSRPRYEAVSLAEVARGVAELFQLSVSSSLKVIVDAEDGLEPLSVEPRLLRLALFNLLSNASDAIKRSTTPENPGGEIRLRLRAGEDRGQLIEVHDSGNGIRTPDGRLLEPDETAAIFELGYSTKEQGAGEGLGLNWVQQIVRDFHDGEIEARNRPGGGALFTIRLPPREHGEEDRPPSTTQEQEKP